MSSEIRKDINIDVHVYSVNDPPEGAIYVERDVVETVVHDYVTRNRDSIIKPISDDYEAIREDFAENENVRSLSEEDRKQNESSRETAEQKRVDAESARADNEEERQKSESERNAQEQSRIDSDNFRVANENLRIISESERTRNEATRISGENARILSEASRISSEQARELAEQSRVTSEDSRKESEDSRSSEETKRQNAELTRIQNESTRQLNEESRAQSEESRTQAESSRYASEIARQQAETDRSEAETARASAESERALAETARHTAEGARANAESERIIAESVRIEAEQARESAEQSRVSSETTREVNENAREANEIARQEAELARNQNEATRQSNEVARQEAETVRVTAETARQEAEENRGNDFDALKTRAEETIKAVDEAKARAEEIVDTLGDYDEALTNVNDDLTQLGKKHDEEISDVDARLKILEGLTDVSELTFKDIQKIVQSGLAQKYFSIGDQITTKWRDGATEYDWIWDVVSFEDSELESGDIVPSMILQAHYASPFGIQFNRNGALYVVEDEPLVAGTYNFTIGTTWGTYCKAGTTYQFTLPTDLPVGGQLVIGTASSTTGGCPDNNPTSWRIHVFESNTATVAREILTLSEGSDGTSLGITTSSIKYADNPKINNLQCASYGYNRWAKSAIRKYLNSDLEKLLWWEPQYKFDGPPLELTTKDGFMRGFDKDFLSVVKPIKIKTCCNYVTEGGTSSSPAIDETYDTFWLPSLEQEYCAPQVSGIEGTYFPYWKEVLGLDEPQVSGSSNANPNHIRYALNSKASAQHVRLRSANRGVGNITWFVHSTGYASNYTYAADSYRFAPACAIC